MGKGSPAKRESLKQRPGVTIIQPGAASYVRGLLGCPHPEIPAPCAAYDGNWHIRSQDRSTRSVFLRGESPQVSACDEPRRSQRQAVRRRQRNRIRRPRMEDVRNAFPSDPFSGRHLSLCFSRVSCATTACVDPHGPRSWQPLRGAKDVVPALLSEGIRVSRTMHTDECGLRQSI